MKLYVLIPQDSVNRFLMSAVRHLSLIYNQKHFTFIYYLIFAHLWSRSFQHFPNYFVSRYTDTGIVSNVYNGIIYNRILSSHKKESHRVRHDWSHLAAAAEGGIGWRWSKGPNLSYKKMSTRNAIYNVINITKTPVCYTWKLLRK